MNDLLYLKDIITIMQTPWPDNRTINIVCHGHSVPSGYMQTPVVNTFDAYPHLLHVDLKHRFPFAVINVIVTAIGGEHSEAGNARFDDDVLNHKPDLITIDYGLNDRFITLERAHIAWCEMVEKALAKDIKVILLTPTPDFSGLFKETNKVWNDLLEHANDIRNIAKEYNVGLSDTLKVFEDYMNNGGDLNYLLASQNHPNRYGHEMVVEELMQFFPPYDNIISYYQ